MAWFIETTLGNMTQKTKHATFKEAIDSLHNFEKQFADKPKENVAIRILFRLGPQEHIAAKQAREAKA